MIKLSTGVFFLMLTLNLFSQQLTKDQVVEDLNHLIQGIEKYNPALKQYYSNFNIQAKAIVESVEQDVSIVEAFALFNRLGALSNEGHFRVDANKVFQGILDNTVKYMPLSIKIVSGKIYIQNIFTENPLLQPFDQILSINGKNTEDILREFYLHIPSDGAITTYQSHKASGGFAWMYYMFIEQAEEFKIVYRSLQSKRKETVVVPAITRAAQFANLGKQPKVKGTSKKTDSIDDFYKFEIRNDYAYLHLKSFDYRLVNRYELNAKKFYEQIFQKIKEKQVTNLVIDLRNNTGGRLEFSNELVPFILQSREADFFKKSVSWKGKKKRYKFPKRHNLAYKGKIYVLVNGLTFSAAANMTRYLKEYGKAVIIGEETGSRYEGYAAGSSEIVDLPHSKIKIYIPRYHTIFPKSKIQRTSNRGTMPDIEILTTIQDLQTGQDQALETVLNLIK